MASATYYKILKVLYGWLVDDEELDTDPCRPTRSPSSRPTGASGCSPTA
jgi:hypothetical protein